MAERLTIDDADGLRELADRSRRAAATARRSAKAEPLNSDGEEIRIGVTASYHPGDPGCMYMPNGDPGYPPDPDEIEFVEIKSLYM